MPIDVSVKTPSAPTNGKIPVDAHAARLARELASEFEAPAAILDLGQRSWARVEGRDVSQFPGPYQTASEAAGNVAVVHGDVSVWRRQDDPSIVWLLMPLEAPDRRRVLGCVGFADWKYRGILPEREGDCPWGPPCPDQALAAWGRQAQARLRPPEALPPSGGVEGDEECEHTVIGRLIRRLRISDAPRDFQSLAANVLRTSLKVAAVVWVPKDPKDRVVMSGHVEGVPPQAYRAFPSPSGRDSTVVSRDGEVLIRIGAPLAVRRYASVAAGSLGWLLAVNPLGDRLITSSDVERMQYVASLIATQLSNNRTYGDLKELLFGIIRALTAAIDAKDPYTSGHSERVARIAVRIAEEMGISAPKRSDLYLAGLLHDVGKIGIDDQVLKKTDRLTPAEYEQIQSHVEIGVTILKDLKKLSHIIPGVRHHHESLDGTGYPDHLLGEEIPIEARILAVADAFDAMSSNRPYRKRLSLAQIDRIFTEGKGVQWDPVVIEALFACRGDLEAIRQKGLGESLIGAVNVTLGQH